MIVKFLSKIKFLILLINISLVVCGVLFILSKFKKVPMECVSNEKIEQSKQIENNIIDELTTCQSDLFKAKNDLEQTKLIPDARKNIISLLMVIRDVEKDIGNKRNFSNECVKIFTLCSRIPYVQEFALGYKDKLFENNCNFETNSDILEKITPFQVELLKIQKDKEKKDEKFFKRFLFEMKYHISKLFVKSKIQKSDLEIAVEQYNYKDALSFLVSSGFERNDDYNKLYSSISVLKNFKEMIEGIYDIISVNNN